MEPTQKNCYSDSELQEFKEVILNKLEIAKEELDNVLSLFGKHDGDHNKLAEVAATNIGREQNNQLASRLQKFIDQLNAALVRIENKTYGICRTTGKLIAKGRLLAVPHTTQCMAAKLEEAA